MNWDASHSAHEHTEERVPNEEVMCQSKVLCAGTGNAFC